MDDKDLYSVDTDYITINSSDQFSDIDLGNFTIDVNNTTSFYTINTTMLGSGYSNGYSNVTWAPNTTTDPNFTVTGDAKFEGDISIKGRSLTKMLETIEKRLAILQPNPKKLAKYEALQKAYEHYKTLEALCDLPEDEEDGS